MNTLKTVEALRALAHATELFADALQGSASEVDTGAQQAAIQQQAEARKQAAAQQAAAQQAAAQQAAAQQAAAQQAAAQQAAAQQAAAQQAAAQQAAPPTGMDFASFNNELRQISIQAGPGVLGPLVKPILQKYAPQGGGIAAIDEGAREAFLAEVRQAAPGGAQ